MLETLGNQLDGCAAAGPRGLVQEAASATAASAAGDASQARTSPPDAAPAAGRARADADSRTIAAAAQPADPKRRELTPREEARYGPTDDAALRRRQAARGMRRFRRVRPSRCGGADRARPARAAASRSGGGRHRLLRRQPASTAERHVGLVGDNFTHPARGRQPAAATAPSVTTAIRPMAARSSATSSRCSPSSPAAASPLPITAT